MSLQPFNDNYQVSHLNSGKNSRSAKQNVMRCIQLSFTDWYQFQCDRRLRILSCSLHYKPLQKKLQIHHCNTLGITVKHGGSTQFTWQKRLSLWCVFLSKSCLHIFVIICPLSIFSKLIFQNIHPSFSKRQLVLLNPV